VPVITSNWCPRNVIDWLIVMQNSSYISTAVNQTEKSKNGNLIAKC